MDTDTFKKECTPELLAFYNDNEVDYGRHKESSSYPSGPGDAEELKTNGNGDSK